MEKIEREPPLHKSEGVQQLIKALATYSVIRAENLHLSRGITLKSTSSRTERRRSDG